MKKLVAVTVLILAVVAISYWKFKPNVKQSEMLVTAQPVSDEQLAGVQDVNLGDVLSLGRSLKCNFDKGVVYMGSGKIRSNPTQPGSHMYWDGQVKYVWWDDQEIGWKYQQTERYASYGVGSNWALLQVEAVGKFKCTDWEVQENVFDLPKGITFTDPPRLGGPGM